MTAGANDRPLPVVRAADLARGRDDPSWLFEGLWGEAAVGIVGGAPKCCKSFLGLDMAVSLASGRPCLGVYAVERPGPVLVYMAEDAAAVVRRRLAALCEHRGLDLAALPVYVITADALRLDRPDDQRRLRSAVERIRPRMVLLDPLVRLHRLNENDAGEVSALLAYFRQLQRACDTAIVLVHHSRKNGSAAQPGQALRGSGDLHAFGDSNLYLRRTRDRLVLTFEHRAAPAPDPVELRLVTGDRPRLEVVGPATDARAREPIDERLLQCLARHGRPMTRQGLRKRLGVRNARLGEALNRMLSDRSVRRDPAGFALPTPGTRSRPRD